MAEDIKNWLEIILLALSLMTNIGIAIRQQINKAKQAAGQSELLEKVAAVHEAANGLNQRIEAVAREAGAAEGLAAGRAEARGAPPGIMP
jgi:hypothetical protein